MTRGRALSKVAHALQLFRSFPVGGICWTARQLGIGDRPAILGESLVIQLEDSLPQLPSHLVVEKRTSMRKRRFCQTLREARPDWNTSWKSPQRSEDIMFKGHRNLMSITEDMKHILHKTIDF